MIRKIVHIGNPALRQVAETVDSDAIHSAEIQTLIEDLIETMRDANGAGLALQPQSAHQVTSQVPAHSLLDADGLAHEQARAFLL